MRSCSSEIANTPFSQVISILINQQDLTVWLSVKNDLEINIHQQCCLQLFQAYIADDLSMG